MKLNPEFQFHKLNQTGIDFNLAIATIFDDCLNELKEFCPEGRHFDIVKTKLEEACFFAKKAMASQESNHIHD